MEKREFKAESKRLLDLMINSIYTNKEIFLRELISNASDAIDKLRFWAVSDSSLNINQSDFEIRLKPDKDNRTLIISDNGIGMNSDELADNLGIIAASGTGNFRSHMAQSKVSGSHGTDSESASADSAQDSGAEFDKADLIGRFGVGFYSAFMVADHIKVVSRRYDSDTAYCWESDGIDGYTIAPATKDSVGTDIYLHIRPEVEADSDEYNCYLREYPLYKLVRKYSDYIRYPIRMLMPHPIVTNETEINEARHRLEAARMCGGNPAGITVPEPEYSEEFEYETLNSMIPLWHRSRSEVSESEYNEFYKEHFGDKQNPLSVITASVEGNLTYRALLYIPGHAPEGYGSDAYNAGLELYSNGVLIMKDCKAILPEEFNFVRGVVDSQDISLNISREMLQQTRELSAICNNISKKIKSELRRLLINERDTYLEFNKHFGHHLKVCAMDEYGAKKDFLGELLLFYSAREKKLITLEEYILGMTAEQKFIYYATGNAVTTIDSLPQIELVRDQGMDILYFTDKADEFVSDMFRAYRDKHFKSVIDGDLGLGSDTSKQDTEYFRATFDFIAETLGDEIDEVRATSKLKSHPVCLTSGEGVTFEMERYFKSIHPDAPIKAKRILELNTRHQAFLALDNARIADPETAKKYCRILLNQAKMISGLPIADPGAYTDLIVSLWKF